MKNTVCDTTGHTLEDLDNHYRFWRWQMVEYKAEECQRFYFEGLRKRLDEKRRCSNRKCRSELYDMTEQNFFFEI